MSGHGAKFPHKKEAAAAALLTQRTVEDAAQSVGIGPATLRRWQKEPEFQAIYRSAKWAAYSQSIGRLHQMSSAAVSTLGKVMVDPATPPAVKVRAADSILNHTTKSIETENLEARLSELERAAETTKDRRSRWKESGEPEGAAPEACTQTLLRWLKLPEFQAAYREARREAVHQAVARLQQATGAAAITVLKLMTDPNVPAAVKLRAAECVFAHAIKGIELEDFEARLTELERAAESAKDRRHR